MTMTRKDYNRIAATIAKKRRDELEADNPDGADVLEELARDLAQELMYTSPAFDAERFTKACRA